MTAIFYEHLLRSHKLGHGTISVKYASGIYDSYSLKYGMLNVIYFRMCWNERLIMIYNLGDLFF